MATAHICSQANLIRNIRVVEEKIRLGHADRFEEINKRIREVERLKMLRQSPHIVKMIQFICDEVYNLSVNGGLYEDSCN